MMNSYHGAVQNGALALATLLGSFYSSADARQTAWAEAQQTPPSAVACYFVGRFYVNATTGKGEVAGYFSDINGIGESDSLFNGSPSERTAFFTFRSDTLSLTSLPSNGDISLFLGSAGRYNIYYNPSPKGDWSNPNSFSGGEPFPGHPIAHFMRPEFLNLQFDSFSLSLHAITESLVASEGFSFNGHEYNFSELTPGGVTLYNSVSNTPLAGAAGFTFALPYAGHCVLAGEDRD
jgi:hypothetical protein